MRSRIPAALACALWLGCSAPPPTVVPKAAAAKPAAMASASAPAPAVPAKRQPATGTFDDARRHLVRGAAAIEMAKTDADLAPAADEFQMATEISPGWAFAWYNLGFVQARMGQLANAMTSYRQFLALAPADKDAGKVSDEIIKLEFRMEQAAAIQGRAGAWMTAEGNLFQATAEGNHLVLRSDRIPMSSQELQANTFWTDTPTPPQRELRLELQGTKVTGSSSRSEMVVGKCTVPADLAEVTGSYDQAGSRLSLAIPCSRFEANTRLDFFLEPVDCSGVSVIAKEVVQMELRGPVPEGGIGAWTTTRMVKGRWSHTVGGAAAGSPAAGAGLRARDQILAIDGVDTGTLPVGELLWRMRGAPGSELALTVQHHKEQEPVEIRCVRAKLPPS